MKKIIIFTFCMMLLLCSIPTIAADSGPELEIKILPGPSFPAPAIKVTNIGDETAHNVHLTNVNIDGNVLFNNRGVNIANTLDSDNFIICTPNSWIIGFGLFTMNVTIECDEGVFISESSNGFIIGALQLIP